MERYSVLQVRPLRRALSTQLLSLNGLCFDLTSGIYQLTVDNKDGLPPGDKDQNSCLLT